MPELSSFYFTAQQTTAKKNLTTKIIIIISPAEPRCINTKIITLWLVLCNYICYSFRFAKVIFIWTSV